MKVYISPSDQKNNAYATGNTTEAVQCRRIAECLKIAFTRCGIDSRLDPENVDMYGRAKNSNAWGADLHLCIHTNAFNSSVGGTRVFYYSRESKGYSAAMDIFGYLAPVTPGKADSVKQNNTWYEMCNTQMPSVYIECEFHDNPQISPWIIANVETIAEAICKGVCKYSNITYIPKTAEPEETGQPLYRIQLGAFRKRENAATFLESVQVDFPQAFIVSVIK